MGVLSGYLLARGIYLPSWADVEPPQHSRGSSIVQLLKVIQKSFPKTLMTHYDHSIYFKKSVHLRGRYRGQPFSRPEGTLEDVSFETLRKLVTLSLFT